MQGRNAETRLQHAILKYALPRDKFSFTQVAKEFKKSDTPATVAKHLKILVASKYLDKNAGSKEENFRPRYSITEKGRSFLAENAKGRLVDSAQVLAMLDQENVGGWKRVLEMMKQEGFIGDVEIMVKKEGKKSE